MSASDSSPNALPGEPGARQPQAPLPIPEVFAQRHVNLTPIPGPVDQAVQALDQVRAGRSPNAIEEPTHPAPPPRILSRHLTPRRRP